MTGNEVNILTLGHTKAPFIWREVVPGKRVTLPAESTSASVYVRKKLTPLPKPTALTHALIVLP